MTSTSSFLVSVSGINKPMGEVRSADVRGRMPVAGQQVLVREPEANLVALGTVNQIDENDRLVYVAVDWTQLAPDRIPTPEEFLRERRALALSTDEPIDRQNVMDGATLLPA